MAWNCPSAAVQQVPAFPEHVAAEQGDYNYAADDQPVHVVVEQVFHSYAVAEQEPRYFSAEIVPVLFPARAAVAKELHNCAAGDRQKPAGYLMGGLLRRWLL